MSYLYAGYYEFVHYGGIDVLPTSIADAADSTETAVRKQFWDMGRKVADIIDTGMEFAFIPYSEIRYFDARNNSAILESGSLLDLRTPMMQLDSVTLGDATSLTVSTEVRGNPRHKTPIDRLQIIDGAGNWKTFDTDWIEAIEIGGLWGYRQRFATDGFVDSGDDVKDALGISATDTTITVADTNGTDTIGWSPRFDLGQLIRIESEYLIITAVSYTSNTITVLRGQQGTTAATHVLDTDIFTFKVDPTIVEAAALATAWEVGRRGQFAQVQTGVGITVTTWPKTWPDRVLWLLDKIKRGYIAIGSV